MPYTKLDYINKDISSELLKMGIINKKNQIIDKKAFFAFIDKRLEQATIELGKIEKNGVTIDARRADELFSEIKYLEDMKKYEKVNPYEFIPENENDDKQKKTAKKKITVNKKDLEAYFEEREKKKHGLLQKMKLLFTKNGHDK